MSVVISVERAFLCEKYFKDRLCVPTGTSNPSCRRSSRQSGNGCKSLRNFFSPCLKDFPLLPSILQFFSNVPHLPGRIEIQGLVAALYTFILFVSFHVSRISRETVLSWFSFRQHRMLTVFRK